jgi:hypothetical protein
MKFDGEPEGRETTPRAARIDVSYDVLVRCEAGEIEARILNVSGRGFRLQASQPLEVGWHVTVEALKLSPVKAVIRWTVGLDCGGTFLEPVAL